MSDLIPYAIIALCAIALSIAAVNGILDRGDNTAGWS